MSLAVKQKTEDAIVAYILARIAAEVDDTPLDPPFGIAAAHSEVTFTLPCCVVECPRAQEISPDSGWFRVDLVIHIFTSMDEVGETDAVTVDTIHPQRISQMTGYINDLVDGEIAPLNPPDSGEDTREVKGFRCMGVAYSEETADQEDSHLFDQLRFEVHCMPYDGVVPEFAEIFINGDIFIQ